MAVNYKRKTETITFDEGENMVSFHGFAVPELTELVEENKDAAVALWDRFSGRDPNSFSDEDVITLAMDVVTTAPKIAFHAIALATDSDVATVSMLPIDVQIAVLERSVQMSASMQGGVKNLVETVKRIARGAGGLLNEMKSPRT